MTFHVFLIVLVSLTSYIRFSHALTCKLRFANQTTLLWQDESQSYIALPTEQFNMSSSDRLLRLQEQHFGSGSKRPLQSSVEGGMNPFADSVRQLGDQTQWLNRSDVVNVTECWCGNVAHQTRTYYCPLEVNHCQANRGVATMCFQQTTDDYITSALWPVAITAFFLLSCILLLSFHGRCVCGYVISCFCPEWNKKSVDWMLQHNPNMAHFLIRQCYERQRQRVEDRYLEFLAHHPGPIFADPNQAQRTPNQEPKVLCLKVKVYRSVSKNNATLAGKSEQATSSMLSQKQPSTYSGTSEPHAHESVWAANTLDLTAEEESALTDDHACTICFAPIRDGERVGSLACCHVFHVDCLKVWLKRRNVCPLCLRPEIALPDHINKDVDPVGRPRPALLGPDQA